MSRLLVASLGIGSGWSVRLRIEGACKKLWMQFLASWVFAGKSGHFGAGKTTERLVSRDQCPLYRYRVLVLILHALMWAQLNRGWP